MRRARVLLILALLAICSQIAVGESLRSRVTAIDNALAAGHVDQAVQLSIALGDDANVPLDDRVKAYSKAFDLQKQLKHTDEAIGTIGKLLALPIDDGRRKSLMTSQADLTAAAGHVPQAVQLLTDLAAKYPDDDETNAAAHLTAAGYLSRTAQPGKAVEQYDAALQRLARDDPRTPDVLWAESQAAWSIGQVDQSLQAATQLTDERYASSPHFANREAHERVIAALLKLNKATEAIAQLHAWEKSDPSDEIKQHWALRAAQTAQITGQPDAALAAFRRLFTEHAGSTSTEGWYEAQIAIADHLAAAGDLAGALKAAHILLDAAGDQASESAAGVRIIDLLQKLDGNKTRAKAFIAYQINGTGAKQGAAGTDDPKINPLLEIGYPEDAERSKAFADAFANVGDDFAATLHRAHLCLYAGRPTEAMAFYREALRRSSNEDWSAVASALLINGLRPVRGTGAGMEPAAKFLLYGPAGVDGKTGTADDLPDPFQPPADHAATPAPWAAPALSADDRAALTRVQASLRNAVSDPSFGVALRQSAIHALVRTDDVLDQRDDVDRLLALAGDGEHSIADPAVSAVLKMARGGEIHLARLRDFFANDPLPAGAAKRTEAEFRRVTKGFERFLAKSPAVPKLPSLKG